MKIDKKDPVTAREAVTAGVGILWLLFGALVVGTLFGGCVYRGAKITEGTDLAVGFSVPGTEGVCQLNLFNWLSGFRLGVAENSILHVRYTTAETNSYFGVITTRTAKSVDAKVTPCEIERADGAQP